VEIRAQADELVQQRVDWDARLDCREASSKTRGLRMR